MPTVFTLKALYLPPIHLDLFVSTLSLSRFTFSNNEEYCKIPFYSYLCAGALLSWLLFADRNCTLWCTYNEFENHFVCINRCRIWTLNNSLETTKAFFTITFLSLCLSHHAVWLVISFSSLLRRKKNMIRRYKTCWNLRNKKTSLTIFK